MDWSVTPAPIRRGSGTGGRKQPRAGFPSGPGITMGKDLLSPAPVHSEGGGIAVCGFACVLQQGCPQSFDELGGDDVT